MLSGATRERQGGGNAGVALAGRPGMIVYQATKAQFLKHAFEEDIHDVVGAAYKARTGRRVGPSEFSAWKESLVSMAKVLSDPDIPENSGIAIEYGIPGS